MWVVIKIFVQFSLFSYVISDCYFPDGSNATGLKPCDPDAEVSHCCRVGDVCVTNGMCFSSGLGSLVRRGCTDSSWKSGVCPKACVDTGRLEATLTYCGNYNQFCCGDDKAARECCENPGNSTLAVNVTSGEAIYPTVSTDDDTASLKASRTALIVLTTVFGVGLLVAAWFAYQGRNNGKDHEIMREEIDKEHKRVVKVTQELHNLEMALDKVILPEEIRAQIEQARRPRTQLEPFQLEQNGHV